MFSRTESVSMRLNDWKTTPMCERRKTEASVSLIFVTSRPPTWIAPRWGRSKPAARWRNVDLPLPLGPMSAANAPRSRSKSKSRKTSRTAVPER